MCSGRGDLLAVTFVHYRRMFPLLGVTLVCRVVNVSDVAGPTAPYPLLLGASPDIYLVGWPVLLALALVSGLIERRTWGAKPSSESIETP